MRRFIGRRLVYLFPAFFPEHEEIARLKRIVLAQADEIERLKETAWTDSLTGLLTRRGMKEKLHSYAAFLNRRQDPFLSMRYVVVIVDLDDFSEINNVYAHAIGDKALTAVAEAIRSCFRKDDICGRWGGDEFVVIMPNTMVKDMDHHLKEFRMKLALISTSPDFIALQMRRAMTASVGLTELNAQANDELALWTGIEGAIAAADTAMYVGKNDGKDKVVIASPGPIYEI